MERYRKTLCGYMRIRDRTANAKKDCRWCYHADAPVHLLFTHPSSRDNGFALSSAHQEAGRSRPKLTEGRSRHMLVLYILVRTCHMRTFVATFCGAPISINSAGTHPVWEVAKIANRGQKRPRVSRFDTPAVQYNFQERAHGRVVVRWSYHHHSHGSAGLVDRLKY